jgi:hypothetical protein
MVNACVVVIYPSKYHVALLCIGKAVYRGNSTYLNSAALFFIVSRLVQSSSCLNRKLACILVRCAAGFYYTLIASAHLCPQTLTLTLIDDSAESRATGQDVQVKGEPPC